jgi:hypothetical protein
VLAFGINSAWAQYSPAPDIRIYVNNQQIAFPDEVPWIDLSAGRVLVPVRFPTEALGAQVDWGPKNASPEWVTIKDKGTEVKLMIGSRNFTVNHVPKFMDTESFLTPKGRTMVPLRFVSEALGARVEWAKAELAVYITLLTDSTDQFNKELSLPEPPKPWLIPLGWSEEQSVQTLVKVANKRLQMTPVIAEGYTWNMKLRAKLLYSPFPDPNFPGYYFFLLEAEVSRSDKELPQNFQQALKGISFMPFYIKTIDGVFYLDDDYELVPPNERKGIPFQPFYHLAWQLIVRTVIQEEIFSTRGKIPTHFRISSQGTKEFAEITVSSPTYGVVHRYTRTVREDGAVVLTKAE